MGCVCEERGAWRGLSSLAIRVWMEKFWLCSLEGTHGRAASSAGYTRVSSRTPTLALASGSGWVLPWDPARDKVRMWEGRVSRPVAPQGRGPAGRTNLPPASDPPQFQVVFSGCFQDNYSPRVNVSLWVTPRAPFQCRI